MADKVTDILTDLAAALALPNSADGYNYTAGQTGMGIVAFENIRPGGFPAAFITGWRERRENNANNRFRSIIDVTVEGFIKNSTPADHAQGVKDLAKWLADLTKAINTDPTRAGHSTYTEIKETDTDRGMFLAFGPFGGVQLQVECDYRTLLTTP